PTRRSSDLRGCYPCVPDDGTSAAAALGADEQVAIPHEVRRIDAARLAVALDAFRELRLESGPGVFPRDFDQLGPDPDDVVLCDHPDELSFLDDGESSDLALRHQLRGLGDFLVRMNHDHGGRHDVPDEDTTRLFVRRGDFRHDVPLRDDAHRLAGLDHHEAPDLRIAREALEAYVVKRAKRTVEIPKAFETKSGAFVTLNEHPSGLLRGCIGYPQPFFPLVKSIEKAAEGAAEDPRFPRLTSEELDRVTVEVSILTPPE